MNDAIFTPQEWATFPPELQALGQVGAYEVICREVDTCLAEYEGLTAEERKAADIEVDDALRKTCDTAMLDAFDVSY